jgi:hypothetical protein
MEREPTNRDFTRKRFFFLDVPISFPVMMLDIYIYIEDLSPTPFFSLLKNSFSDSEEEEEEEEDLFLTRKQSGDGFFFFFLRSIYDV